MGAPRSSGAAVGAAHARDQNRRRTYGHCSQRTRFLTEPRAQARTLEGVNAPTLDQLQRIAAYTVSTLPDHVFEMARLFEAAGHELALVGGPVRDAFLGHMSHDLDFATSARPEETEEILRSWSDTHWGMGREFGTIGARKGDTVVEVTTYRSEDYESDSRKPKVTYGSSLEGDLTRRDFTVNAMAVRLPSCEFVDPTGGQRDLAEQVLVTPARPEQSFSDDPLRIMRAARFTAQLGFVVEAETMSAMTSLADRLAIVSAERIRSELERLITARWPRKGLELLVYTGVADHVLPELSRLQDAVDPQHRHKDVYEHSLTVLEQAIDLETDAEGAVPGPDFTLRFAALMHDVGKPATRRFERNGQVTFHHHEVVGAKMTRERMRALRFDTQTIKDVTKLVELHQRFHGYGEAKWSDSAVRRYVTDAGDQLDRLHRLTRADCTTRNVRKAMRLAAAYDDLEARIDELKEQEELDSIRPELDGTQIMEILGIPAGRQVGEAYRFLLEIRMEEGPIGQDAARERLLAWWADR